MNHEESKKTSIVKLLLVVFLCCSIGGTAGWAGTTWLSEWRDGVTEQEEDETATYVLYIGLDDKYTKEQSCTTAEAAERINRICETYVEGYSYIRMKGGWKDRDGIFIRENTLVYQFMDVTEETMLCMMDEVLEQLNQDCVLLEERKGEFRYYYGEGNEGE